MGSPNIQITEISTNLACWYCRHRMVYVGEADGSRMGIVSDGVEYPYDLVTVLICSNEKCGAEAYWTKSETDDEV